MRLTVCGVNGCFEGSHPNSSARPEAPAPSVAAIVYRYTRLAPCRLSHGRARRVQPTRSTSTPEAPRALALIPVTSGQVLALRATLSPRRVQRLGGRAARWVSRRQPRSVSAFATRAQSRAPVVSRWYLVGLGGAGSAGGRVNPPFKIQFHNRTFHREHISSKGTCTSIPFSPGSLGIFEAKTHPSQIKSRVWAISQAQLEKPRFSQNMRVSSMRAAVAADSPARGVVLDERSDAGAYLYYTRE